MSKGHGRLNWANRQSPGEFDESAPPAKPTYEFDLRRNTLPGGQSWPERLQGEKFGPSFVSKAWKAGLVVVAEIPGFPYHVAVSQAKWSRQVLVVVTLEGERVPDRLYTRKSMKGFDSSGLLINPNAE